MTRLRTAPLDSSTWPDFAALVERNNGVWGGCWCMGFHSEGVNDRDRTPEQNRADKECRVAEGRAHAALVFDGDTCVGWCQFGSPDELPRIKSRRAYEAEPTELPHWRITCFYVDKGHRGEGVASAALAGALRRSPSSAAERWRASPRMSRAARSPARSCTTRRSRCSSSRASSAPAGSARTGGSCDASCARDARPRSARQRVASGRARPGDRDAVRDPAARGRIPARADGGRRPRHLRREVPRRGPGTQGAGRRGGLGRAGPAPGPARPRARPRRRRSRPGERRAGRGGPGPAARERRTEPRRRLPAWGARLRPGRLPRRSAARPGRVLWFDAVVGNMDRSCRNPNLLEWRGSG